jgi:hypothetical protein
MILSHRRKGTIKVFTDESGEITHRHQYDLCPYCSTVLIWEQYCDVYTEDDNGVMQPDWGASEAWHSDCVECDVSFVDPYNDGLLRVYQLSDSEAD